MNALYKLILLCSIMASCHSDYGRRQLPQHKTNNSSIASDIDMKAIDFYSQTALESTNQITKSIYYSADFNYYDCIVSSQSNPHIEVFFKLPNIYIISDVYQFRDCHFLEFSDIDDLKVSIPQPKFSIGEYKQYFILKMPIKSKIECLFKMNIILNYTTEYEESLKFK